MCVPRLFDGMGAPMLQWARQCRRRERTVVFLRGMRHRAATAFLPARVCLLLTGLRLRLFLLVFPRGVRLISIWPGRLVRASATRARTARSRTYPGLLPALVSTRPCARSPQMTSLLRAPLSRRMKRRAVNARRGLLPIGERLARNSEPRKCSRASLAPMIAIGRKRLGLRYIRPRWAKATRERSRTSADRRLRANARRLPLKGRRHRASSPPVLQSS